VIASQQYQRLLEEKEAHQGDGRPSAPSARRDGAHHSSEPAVAQGAARAHPPVNSGAVTSAVGHLAEELKVRYSDLFELRRYIDEV
jgi:hypothetical protein